MATKVPIPKLGQSEETVTIDKWHAKEGDVIKKGDVLFEVETDKSVLEVESQFEGTVLKIITPAGVEVPVMTIAAILGEPGEEIPEIEQPKTAAPEPKKASAPAKKKPAPAKKEAPKPATASSPAPSAPAPQAAPAPAPAKVKPSPRAKAFAKDYLIDLSQVQGTGGDVGRVTEKDVKNYLETTGYFDKKITPAALNVAKQENLTLTQLNGTGENNRITLLDVQDAIMEKPQEFSTMRKIIAQRLTQSKQQIPHFYVTVSVDMTDLLEKRKALKEDGINISVNVFLIKAIAESLKLFPMLNATATADSISYKSKVNIGVAVSLEGGLVVPVVKNADKKALDEIHAEVAELAEKARTNKLQPDDMKGGTFTISNMGMLGVENFAAIINPGEAAILAVSATIPTPVVIDGEITIRNMMKVTLSADHRAVDGADGAKFLAALKEKLESADMQ